MIPNPNPNPLHRQVGEVVDDRYEVFATHGRGVFSSVLRVKDLLSKAPAGSQQEVAIKIIRANETMCACNEFSSSDGVTTSHMLT